MSKKPFIVTFQLPDSMFAKKPLSEWVWAESSTLAKQAIVDKYDGVYSITVKSAC